MSRHGEPHNVQGNQWPQKIELGESIPEKTCQALRNLGWHDPNTIQDIRGELSQAKTTMVVNFGPNGSATPDLITGEEYLREMVVKVFQYYHDELMKGDKT